MTTAGELIRLLWFRKTFGWTFAGWGNARECDLKEDLCQYESLLRTSPPFRVPMAHHVWTLTVSLMKRTEPSDIAMLTPPEWLLLGGIPSTTFPQPSVFPSALLKQPLPLGSSNGCTSPRSKPTPHGPKAERCRPGASSPPFAAVEPGRFLQVL